jgi:hypothetical protein
MIEGDLEIHWANNYDLGATPRYQIRFRPYQGFSGGAQKSVEFVGDATLTNYLVSQQGAQMPDERRQKRAHDWLLEIRSNGSITLSHFQISEQEAARFLPRRASCPTI